MKHLFWSCFFFLGVTQLFAQQDISYQNFYNPADMELNSTNMSNAKVGSIAGDLNVNETGGANYQMMIDVPKEGESLMPNLSVVYNSQANINGMLGMNFQLQGISSITRIPKTLYTDGERSGVEVSNNDRFALNGQALLPILGSGSNGADLTQYTTKKQAYTKVTSVAVQGNSPRFFEVEAKGGMTYRYGRNPDSKILDSDGNVLLWKISEAYDKYGNHMSYTYETVNEEHRIRSIQYGGNTLPTRNQSHYMEVVFHYKDRKDKNAYVLHNTRVRDNSLIDKIEVKYNGVKMHDYSFTYAFDKMHSYLIAVQKNGEQGEYYNPTRFSYGGYNFHSNYEPKDANVNPSFSINNFDPFLHDIRVGDFNGDGYDDYLKLDRHDYVITTGGEDYHSSFYMKMTFSIYNPQTNTYVDVEETTLETPNELQLYWQYRYGTKRSRAINIIDIDADGKDEIFFVGIKPITSSLTKFTTHLYELNGYNQLCINSIDISQGLTNFKVVEQGDFPVQFADLTNDGVLDVIYDMKHIGSNQRKIIVKDLKSNTEHDLGIHLTNMSSSCQNLLPSDDMSIYKMKVLDTDRDGQSELVFTNPWTADVAVILNTRMTNGSVVQSEAFCDHVDGLILTDHPGQYVSANKDGFVDILPIGENQVRFSSHNDLNNYPPILQDSYTQGSGKFDFNTDGITDEIWIYKNAADFSFDKACIYLHGSNLENDPNYSRTYYCFNKDANYYYEGNLPMGTVGSSLQAPILNGVAPEDFYNGNSKGGAMHLEAKSNAHDNKLDYLLQYHHFNTNVGNSSGQLVGTNYGVYVDELIRFNFNETKLLKKIRDGYGNYQAIQYAPINNPQVYTSTRNIMSCDNMTYPEYVENNGIYVVSELQSNNVNNGVARKTFKYEDATSYLKNGGFLGFKRTITDDHTSFIRTVAENELFSLNNGSNNQNTSSFRPKKLETYYFGGGGNPELLSRQTFDEYLVHEFAQQNNLVSNIILPTKIITTDFLNGGTKVVEDLYHPLTGNKAQRIERTYKDVTYNQNGTITLNSLDLLGETKEQFTYTQTNTWLPFHLESAETWLDYKNGTFDGNEYTKRTYEYYGASDGAKHGLVENITYNQHDNSKKTQEQFFYNDKAQLINHRTWNFQGTSDVNYIGSEGFSYDNVGRLESITNALNYTSINDYYETGAKGGQLKSKQGYDGLVETYHYDGFGTLTSTVSANGVVSTIGISWTTPSVNGSVFKSEETATAQPKETTYYNRHQKVVKQKNEGFTAEVHIDYLYNNLGLKVSETDPYHTNQPFVNVYNLYSYDQYQRIISVERQSVSSSSDWTTSSYSVNSNHERQVSITKPDGRISTKYFDFSGKLLRVVDNVATISHTYYKTGNKYKTFVQSLGGVNQLMQTYEYDLQGNNTRREDHSLGTDLWTYNRFGQLISVTNANLDVTTYRYDVLGRLETQVKPEGETRFSYNNTIGTDGIGKLFSSTLTLNGVQVHKKEFQYNTFGSIKRLEELIEGNATPFVTTYTYGAYDKVASKQTPDHLKLVYDYHPNGFLKQVDYHVLDPNGPIGYTNTLYEPLEVDARGNVTKYNRLNSVQTIKQFDKFGLPRSVKTDNIQELTYDFNHTTGNLRRKWNKLNNKREDFEYSTDLDQLTKSYVNTYETFPNVAGYSYSQESDQHTVYDNSINDNGNNSDNTISGYVDAGNSNLNNDGNANIVYKTGIGKYDYNNPNNNVHQLHAVDQTGENPVDPLIEVLPYISTSFHKPKSITTNNNLYYEWTYGVDEDRVKSEKYSGSSTSGTLEETRYYMGGYEVLEKDGDTYTINYIGFGHGLEAIFKTKNGLEKEMLITHTDYQGTILRLSDINNDVKLDQNFDAWGRERSANTWTYDGEATATVHYGGNPNFAPPVLMPTAASQGLDVTSAQTRIWFNRGYTGHEHLYDVNIINMNARLYDCFTGRFLSPDRYIQDVDNSQNYNRYAYGLNNPTKYTDPSGNFWHVVIGAAVGGLVNWGMHGFQWNSDGLKAFGIGAVAGAAAAVVGFAVFEAVAGAGSVAGAGGFGAGYASGFAAGYTQAKILSPLNHHILGDPLMTEGEILKSSMISGVIGGTVNGTIASAKGWDFWTGARTGVLDRPIVVGTVSVDEIPTKGANTPSKSPGIDAIDDAVTPSNVNKNPASTPKSSKGSLMSKSNQRVSSDGVALSDDIAHMRSIRELNPTHEITKSKNAMKKLFSQIRSDNMIKESIKYVEYDGVKYIVDGHHRFYSAIRLGMQEIPVQRVQLPYLGYKSLDDLVIYYGRQPGFWQYIR